MYQVFTGLGEIALFAYFLPLMKNQVFSKTVSKALCIKSFPVIDHSPYFLTFSPLTKFHVFRKSVLKPSIYQELGGLGFFALFMEFHFLTIGVYHTYKLKSRAIKKGRALHSP